MLILYLPLNILLITARRGKFANLNFTGIIMITTGLSGEEGQTV